MRADVSEYTYILVLRIKNSSIVTRYIDASVSFEFSPKWVIIEKRMELISGKQADPFVRL